LVLGLPLGIVLLRQVEPEAFRRISMAASAAFISFGLARSLVEIRFVTAIAAFGGMSIVVVIEALLLVRFFGMRRRMALAGLAGRERLPRA
jgi:hypothetical protein